MAVQKKRPRVANRLPHHGVVNAASYDTTAVLEWIPNGEIFSDPAYQRRVDLRRVQAMADDFNADAFGVVYVSRRSANSYACLDGFHRISTMRHLDWDDQKVPAMVYSDLSREQEAELFRIMNEQRVKPKALDLFRSRLAAGEKEATNIAAILTGLNLGFDSYAANPGVVRCISTVERVYGYVGATPVRKALQVMTKAWGVESEALNGEVFKGIALLLSVHTDLDLNLLASKLAEITPAQLRAKANTLREFSPGWQPAACMASVIVGIYNYRLRTQSRLPAPWTVSGFSRRGSAKADAA